MNNMKSKAKTIPLQNLSMSIGNFIRYWGFRRIHGALWTQLYLSKTALSCTELSQRLGLSKALVSPALDELSKYKLIRLAPSPNEKTKLYVASEDINEVIQHILKTREAAMLKKITDDFSNLSSVSEKDANLDREKLKSLGEMIFGANLMLEMFISQKDLLKLPTELDL